jgi:hypothetical protein
MIGAVLKTTKYGAVRAIAFLTRDRIIEAQAEVNQSFSRRRLWACLVLVGSNFLGNSWVKSGCREGAIVTAFRWCPARRAPFDPDQPAAVAADGARACIV